MKIVYVAGPFRGANTWEIEQNIRRAETVALAAWKAGVAVICPHANTRFYQGAAPDETWLKGDLEFVRRSDAVLTTPDWQRSIGARGEVDLANRLHLPVFHAYFIEGEPRLPASFLIWVAQAPPDVHTRRQVSTWCDYDYCSWPWPS